LASIRLGGHRPLSPLVDPPLNSRACWRVDGPIIECDRSMADINQFNVYLRCLVRARPSVTSLFWIADANGTTMSDDDVTGNYWSTVTVRLYYYSYDLHYAVDKYVLSADR